MTGTTVFECFTTRVVLNVRKSRGTLTEIEFAVVSVNNFFEILLVCWQQSKLNVSMREPSSGRKPGKLGPGDKKLNLFNK
jgi:hypothetical protein